MCRSEYGIIDSTKDFTPGIAASRVGATRCKSTSTHKACDTSRVDRPSERGDGSGITGAGSRGESKEAQLAGFQVPSKQIAHTVSVPSAVSSLPLLPLLQILNMSIGLYQLRRGGGAITHP